MNFSFSEEQDAIRELGQQILGDACGHDRLAEIERRASESGVAALRAGQLDVAG